MNEQLRNYLESIGLARSATEKAAWACYAGLKGDQKRTAKDHRYQRAVATVPANQPAATAVAATPAVQTPEQTTQAERTRINAINDLCREDSNLSTLATRAIDEGWDTGRLATQILQVQRDAANPLGTTGNPGQAPAGHVRNHERDCTHGAMGAAMLQRAGISHERLEVGREFVGDQRRTQQDRLAEMGDRYRDMSMIDVLREEVRLMGGNTPFNRSEIFRDHSLLSGRAASSGSYSGIFSTVMNAAMMKSYEEAGDTTSGFVSVTEEADFKTIERHLEDSASNMTKHRRSGKADHQSGGDETETYKIARYSAQATVDEQDIIDDRFGVLTKKPISFGLAARRLVPDLVYFILLKNAVLNADSVALFESANHGNLRGNTLDVPNLAVGIADMGKQVHGDARLNLSPTHLLLPHDLWDVGHELTKSPTVVIAGSTDSVRGSMNANASKGIETVQDARLGVAGVTDPDTGETIAGSATNWFLVDGSNPNGIEVAYLRGTNRSPVIRVTPLIMGEWGLNFDANHNVGAKALDFRPLYKGNA